mmetsp:Transcript_25512/g.59782  ORF Transcript_25512/g.59782 Transcript_25512/m.59782 type:complete len:221 (+) Transcript_25512:1257-1919(+)
MSSSASTSSCDFLRMIRGSDRLLVPSRLLLSSHDSDVDPAVVCGKDRPMYSMSSLSRDRPPFLALADSFRGSPCSSGSRTSTRTAVQATVSEAGRTSASKRSFVRSLPPPLLLLRTTRSPGTTTIRVEGWIRPVASIARIASIDPCVSGGNATRWRRWSRPPSFRFGFSSQQHLLTSSSSSSSLGPFTRDAGAASPSSPSFVVSARSVRLSSSSATAITI